MFPDKHLEDLESSRRRMKAAGHLAVAGTFLLSFLVLGQLLHELSHVLVLVALGCPYSVDLGFGLLTGMYAEVYPLCTPDSTYLAVFYASGYLSTLAAGWGVLLRARGGGKRRNFLAAAGTGMLLSVLLTVGSAGDIENFLAVTGLDVSLASPVSVVVALLVIAVSFSGVEMLLGD